MNNFGPEMVSGNEAQKIPIRENNLKSLAEDILNIIAEDTAK